jgi:hypothetical protein
MAPQSVTDNDVGVQVTQTYLLLQLSVRRERNRSQRGEFPGLSFVGGLHCERGHGGQRASRVDPEHTRRLTLCGTVRLIRLRMTQLANLTSIGPTSDDVLSAHSHAR